MPWYEGPCRITVVGVDADWPQRAVVTVRRGPTIVIDGVVGTSQVVDDGGAGHGWDLAVEHQYEGVWRPNVRALVSKWTEVDGVRSQTIRSKDHDWPGRTEERNLVLRIERTALGAPTPGVLTRAVSRSAVQSAPLSQPVPAARTWRTSTESAAGQAQQNAAPRAATESGGAPAARGVPVEGAVAPATRVSTTGSGG